MAAAFLVSFGMAAVVIRCFLHRAGQCMTAASAKCLAFQRIVPLLFVGLGKPELAGLHLFKYRFFNDCRVVVGNDIPLVPILHSAPSAAHFKDSSLADHIGTDVSFILQNTENR